MKHHLRLISLLLAALLLHFPALAGPGAAESLGLAQQHLRQELGLEPEAYALVREHHDSEHGYRTYFFELKDKGIPTGRSSCSWTRRGGSAISGRLIPSGGGR